MLTLWKHCNNVRGVHVRVYNFSNCCWPPTLSHYKCKLGQSGALRMCLCCSSGETRSGQQGRAGAIGSRLVSTPQSKVQNPSPFKVLLSWVCFAQFRSRLARLILKHRAVCGFTMSAFLDGLFIAVDDYWQRTKSCPKSRLYSKWICIHN